ncbi:hypothetical protein [Botrimarina sp.]|uniref:hypothetical protein n=1 Tax=Botrimarina sp. TaxID=2795802 RepID=UPI0032EF1039
MLIFVFIVAVANLAVGYALGAKLTVTDLLEWLPAYASRPAAPEVADGEQLTRPPSRVVLTRPVESQPPASPEAARDPAPSKPPSHEILAGLAKFREKLSATSLELKLNKEDPERFGESASRFQEASHAYLEGASCAIESLDRLGAEGDSAAAASAKAVADGRQAVAQISDQIDGLIQKGLDDDESRKSLISMSEEARKTAEEAETEGQSALAGPEPPAQPAADATPSYASIDAMFDRLDAALEAAASDAVSQVAAVQIDPIPGRENDAELLQQVERAVNDLIADAIDPTQAFTPGRPAMLLLDGDDLDRAGERIEKLRKRIAAAPIDGVAATVTCVLIDARPGDSRQSLVDRLNETLDEATRMGPNRSYHHDGAFPTPIGSDPADDRTDAEAEAAEPAEVG